MNIFGNKSDTYGIVGMSPGNGYFKQEVIDQILEKASTEFSHIGIFIPDIPAIATYVALGYPENIARRDKAIAQGNLFRNRVKRSLEKLHIPESRVHVFSWDKEKIEENSNYRTCFKYVRDLYENNNTFKKDADLATQGVLMDNPFRKKEITQKEIEIGVHYLLSEFAFLLFLPEYIHKEKIAYTYHKPWPVFERFISGFYDGKVKEGMLFVQYPQFASYQNLVS